MDNEYQAVKIISNDDGEEVDEPKWHLGVDYIGGAHSTLCTGEFYGFGESNVVFETKKIHKGLIDCPACVTIITEMKRISL